MNGEGSGAKVLLIVDFQWIAYAGGGMLFRMKNILIALIMLLMWPVICFAQATGGAASVTNDLPDGLYSEITTESGVYVCELFYKKTPMTVANHVGLAEGTLGPRKGTNYYDGLKWF